jgi:hypothetical protein
MAKAKRFDEGGDVGKALLGGLTAIPQAALRALGMKSGLEGGEGSALLEKAMKDKEAQKHMVSQAMPAGAPTMKKGGKVSSASSRADGIAQRGKTKGRYL